MNIIKNSLRQHSMHETECALTYMLEMRTVQTKLNVEYKKRSIDTPAAENNSPLQ